MTLPNLIPDMMLMADQTRADSERILGAVGAIEKVRGAEYATTAAIAQLMDRECADDWSERRTLTALRASQEKGHTGYAPGGEPETA